MASKKVCSYCGTIYSAQMKRCPLCGNDAEEEDRLDLSGVTQPTKAKEPPETDVLQEEYAPDDWQEEAPELPKEPRKAKPAKVERAPQPQTEPEQDPPKKKKEKKEKKHKQPLPKAVAIVCVAFLSVSVVMMSWYLLSQWLPDTVWFPSLNAKEATEASTSPVASEKKECWYLNCDVEKLTLNHEGAAKTLQVDIQPTDCTDALTFTSADASVANVDANGIVTAIGNGQTTVNITCGMLSFDVTVICDFSAKIELEQSELTFESLEETQQLRLTNLGESDVVTWKSSDEAVATVDENGNVKPVGSGVCTVTAEMDGQQYMANITVKGESTYTPDEPGKGVINSDGIYFRSEASSDSDAIGFFMEGYEVEVLGKEGEWYNVSMNGMTGYVHEKYLDVEE